MWGLLRSGWPDLDILAPAKPTKEHTESGARLVQRRSGILEGRRSIETAGQRVPQLPDTLFGLPRFEFEPVHRDPPRSTVNRGNQVDQTLLDIGIVAERLDQSGLDGAFDGHSIANERRAIDQQAG